MFIKVCNCGYVSIDKVTYFDIDTDIESYSTAPEDTYASVDIYFENDTKAGYWVKKEEFEEFLRQLEQYQLAPTDNSWRSNANEIL